MKHYCERASSPGCRYLPGQLAGASLKHKKLRAVGLNKFYLPGQLAGASLKLKIPLIERQRGHISPANWPGPH